jgi:hypothetical protein
VAVNTLKPVLSKSSVLNAWENRWIDKTINATVIGMNKKAIILLLVIILIIIGLVVMKPGSSAKPANTDGPAVSTASSTVYANSAYGISFNYPGKYVAEEKKLNDAQGKRTVVTLITKSDKALLSQIQGPVEGPTSITVEIYEGAAKKQSIGTWVKNTKASNFNLAPSKQYASTSISSIEAVAYSWSGLFSANTVAFAYRDNIIVMTMTYLTPQDAIWKDFGTVIQSLKLN